ncbi:MAG: hypothetical protein L3K23_02855 [Thermoplasmata archaeon]|nr:hypothetical protein [Thermoplasmata archaeon]
MAAFDRRVRTSVDSVMFCGPDRTALAAAAFALASHSERTVTWLDIRNPNRPEDPYVPLFAPLVPPRHRLVTSTPDELAPEIAVSNVATWSLIRQDEPREVVMSLVDFLRLPEAVQRLVTSEALDRTPATLLVTNSDRIAPLYPEDVESTRLYVQAIKSQSIKLVATLPELDRRDRLAYDFVFQVQPGREAGWKESTLQVEAGELPLGSAGRAPTPFGSVDELRTILAAAP